jgi:UDP-N-acetylglucosamine 1-carboxyvinyltransferase
MTQIIINGGKPLNGVLPVFGAKNASLPIICAAVLSDKTVELKNIPDLSDISLLLELLEEIGCQTSFSKTNRSITITPNITNTELSEKANKMRASIWLLSPLLAKAGKVKLPYPGGCSIGGRPIDITLDGLRALGATFEDSEDYLIANTEGLKGANFRMHFPSVGATEGLMIAAARAEGTTVLSNIAVEPEVIDTMDFLNSMGADIKFTDSHEVTINGVATLGETVHNIIPDRIITGTYAVIGALCAGQDGILIDNCRPDHLQTELNVLKAAGVKMDIKENQIFIPAQERNYKATDFETAVYNGFATDLQAPIMMFLTQAEGLSHVTENIYENRFMHVPELNKMGANIHAVSNHIAIVNGKTDLTGASVESTDLRASACLVIAGLIAQGETVLGKIEHLDRGYETLEKFLADIGADIKRV